MYRPSMLEVSLRQQELQREAAQARMAHKASQPARHSVRVFRPFGLRLAPAR
jgi:hypothetical protein